MSIQVSKSTLLSIHLLRNFQSKSKMRSSVFRTLKKNRRSEINWMKTRDFRPSIWQNCAMVGEEEGWPHLAWSPVQVSLRREKSHLLALLFFNYVIYEDAESDLRNSHKEHLLSRTFFSWQIGFQNSAENVKLIRNLQKTRSTKMRWPNFSCSLKHRVWKRKWKKWNNIRINAIKFAYELREEYLAVLQLNLCRQMPRLRSTIFRWTNTKRHSGGRRALVAYPRRKLIRKKNSNEKWKYNSFVLIMYSVWKDDAVIKKLFFYSNLFFCLESIVL